MSDDLSTFPADVLNKAAEAVEAMPARAPFKADVLIAIAKAILADRQRDQWQDISTAPKDGSKFIAWHPDGYVDFFHWQKHSNVGWRDSFIQVYREGSGPTRWMPLPFAPKGTPT